MCLYEKLTGSFANKSHRYAVILLRDEDPFGPGPARASCR